LLASPILLFRSKTRAGLKQKTGLIGADLLETLGRFDKSIWIHAVSVGEFNGAFPFIEALKKEFPDHSIIVSTTTKAGNEMARKRAGKIAQIIYFPFDLPWVVRRILTLANPVLVIIFETELWPNFIYSCKRLNIPVVLLNARMSPRSFRGYKSIKPLFARLLSKLTLIGAQTQAEAESFKYLAGDGVPISVFGNLKYDWRANIDDEKCFQMKKDLGIGKNDLVLVAGSTHPGEEAVILNVYKHFQREKGTKSKQRLKIILAPRHPERFEEVAKIIETEGFTAIRYSRSGKLSHQNDIYLLDTIGLLADYYSLASLAFVGGSIANIGGHNLLEPYLYAVPVVCGPHLDKTKETADILNEAKALYIGTDADEVEAKIMLLLADSNLRERMGQIGEAWLNNNRGAVGRSMAAVSNIIPRSQVKRENNEIEEVPIVNANPWQKLKVTNKENN